MRKYYSLAWMAVLNKIIHPKAIIYSGIFYLVLLFVFTHLWESLYSSGKLGDIFNSYKMVALYFVFCQIIMSSLINKASNLSHDVKSGAMSYALLLPTNYIHYHLFDMLGQWVFSGVFFLLLGILYLVFSYGLPDLSLSCLMLVVASTSIGVLIDYYLNIFIGSLAFWIEDSNSLSWLYNKLLIFAGGAVAPLDIYPHWIRQISDYLPFKYIIYVPSILLTGKDMGQKTESLSLQCLWLVMAIIIAITTFSFGKRRLAHYGG